MSRVLVALASLGVALACGVGYAGFAGYDSTFALIWGRELAGGDAPSFDGAFAPSPHPLANAIGALLSPLGPGAAAAALELLSLAAIVLLGVAAFRLGAALFAPAAGAVAAAVLVTRPELVELALAAQFDVAFLALVLLAAALEAERPRRGVAPLVVLGLAGLLRPEAWILAGAYALYVRRPRALALAAAAPALWAVHDLVLTGDPLFSLHTTGEFAERHDTGAGLADAPDLVLDVIGPVVALGGVAGWLLARRAEQHRIALPAALFGLSVVPFAAYAALGFTLYARFLLPAAAALALLCAAAATGWAARGVAPLVAVALAASLPFTVADLADVRAASADRADREARLVDLLEANRATVDRCPLVRVPGFRDVPPLMHALDLPGERFTDRDTSARALHAERAPGGGWRLRAEC